MKKTLLRILISAVLAVVVAVSVSAQEDTDSTAPPPYDPYGPADLRLGDGLSDVSSLYAEDGTLTFSPYLGFGGEDEKLISQVGMAAGYARGVFGVAFDMMLIRDDKYTPSEPYMFGHRFRMNEGIVEVNPRPLFARAGRGDHWDEVVPP